MSFGFCWRRSLFVPLASGMGLLALCVAAGFWLQAQAKSDFQEIQWETLDLSEQQRQSIQQLDQHWHSTVSEVVPRIQEQEKRLKHLMSSQKPDEPTILQVQQSIHQDKSRLKMEATQIFLRKRKILNKQQENRLLRMIPLD
jgi:hypothetical protein